jgi:type IV secretory pathway TraG/TraD family ATPase VirD4
MQSLEADYRALIIILIVAVLCAIGLVGWIHEWRMSKDPSSKNGRKSQWDLDRALVSFSRPDHFTVRDACQGMLILGATGSGKSSGSGRLFLLSYLTAGFGGIVLTAKTDDRALMEGYCRKAGRLRDLRVFSPSQPWRFNFLDYELNRGGPGAGITNNIVYLFCEVLQIADRQHGQGGREGEAYWRQATRQLLRNSIDLLIMARGTISVPDLYQVVISAPTSTAQVNSPDWQKSSFCYRCLLDADAQNKNPMQARDFQIVADFFTLEFATLSERTRSVIVSTFTSMIDVINRGILRELFCGETNITPEDIERGTILVIDLPVKEYGEVGQFAQVLWKVSFQRAIERRNLALNQRPVFLFADEAQYVITAGDMQFQTTCRSSRVATVYLTQNISNVYAALGGGDHGKAQADSLFANLTTKIFHANGDPVTNEWAASLIGRSRQYRMNWSSGQQGGMGDDGQTSMGMTEQIDFEVQPQRFTTLRTYRPVEGIMFQGGRRFHMSGKTWLPLQFDQG